MRGFFQTEVAQPEQGQGKWRNQLVPMYPDAKVRSNVWGGATLASFNTNPQPDLVKAFMEFTFCSMEGAQATGDWGIIPPYVPWLKSEFKNAKQTLFESGWDWTGEVLKAMDQMRTDFYRMPAYGIFDGATAKYMPAILKGEKSIKDGMKEIGDFVREENKKLLESLK
jgi:ABC-type glycerol-3-phosphate transport system substrate-binding protein